MSIFKVKQWWTNDKLQLDETISGVQNATCLKVEKFNSHSDSDCIVISEEYLLKIYKPYPNQETSNVVLETHLGDVALQIETGKFLTGSVDRQILVLHPQSYAIYQLERKEGHTDAGMVFSMCGLMMRLKWCAWTAVFCSSISFANSRVSDDTKQIVSSFMLSISAVVMSYLQNPAPSSSPPLALCSSFPLFD